MEDIDILPPTFLSFAGAYRDWDSDSRCERTANDHQGREHEHLDDLARRHTGLVPFRLRFFGSLLSIALMLVKEAALCSKHDKESQPCNPQGVVISLQSPV